MSTFSWFDEQPKPRNSATSSSASAAASSYQNQESKSDKAETLMNNTSSSSSNNNAQNSFLRFATVDEVSTYLHSDELAEVAKNLEHYDTQETISNVLLKSDPEYQFVMECGNVCVKIEHEKLKIHRFIVDHFSLRFPELAVLVQDANTFVRFVRLVGNNIHDMDKVMEEIVSTLNIPTPMLASVIACACTTKGQNTPLPEADMENIQQAVDSFLTLEEFKQLVLRYIQNKMILVCRNLSAFLGAGIASQLIVTAGGIDKLSHMSTEEVVTLGSVRGQKVGFAIKTSGFVQNVDLIQQNPPELRTRATRLVADRVVSLARIDANREGADESEGLRARRDVILKMQTWSDPVIQEEQRKKHGLSNKLYEKRSRVNATERQRTGLSGSNSSLQAQRRQRN